MINRISHQPHQAERFGEENEPFLQGMNALGASYYVFGEYANPNSIMKQLFEWNQAPRVAVDFTTDKTYYVPKGVQATLLEEADFKTVGGTDVQSFQKSFSQSVEVSGEYNFFSGSLTSNYNMSELTNVKNAFSFTHNNIFKWSLGFDAAEAKAYLKPAVKNDLDTLDPVQLFDKYGSHFLTGIIIGGVATHNTSTNQVFYQRDVSIELAAELSYKGLTGQLSVEDQTKYSEEINKFRARSSEEIHTLGGLAELGGQNILLPDGFTAWSKSVGSNPVFCGFTTQNALTGIWELCDDATRKAALMSAYATYAKKESDAKKLHSGCITEVMVISGDESYIQAPTGYTKDGYDLNRTARGKYVYVCFEVTAPDKIISGNKHTVVDLVVTDPGQAPEGYITDPTNLNEGTDGVPLYLSYKKSDAAADFDKALKDVMVIGGNNPQIYPPVGYTRIDRDVNQGAGGDTDYIYVCFSKGF